MAEEVESSEADLSEDEIVVATVNETENATENETEDATENETKDATENETEDENEDEENWYKFILNYQKNKSSISYYSHKIDWSNTRVIKTASDYNTFLVLTDDGKVK